MFDIVSAHNGNTNSVQFPNAISTDIIRLPKQPIFQTGSSAFLPLVQIFFMYLNVPEIFLFINFYASECFIDTLSEIYVFLRAKQLRR